MEAEKVTWVRIDSIGFKATPANNLGTLKHDFKDIWFYLDDNLKGTFQVPAKFPIIHQGAGNIIMLPGFMMNGFSGQRPIYTVIEPIRTSDVFVVDDTLVLNPVFRYDTNTVAPFLESFEFGSLSISKTTYSTADFTLVNSPTLSFEGSGCGHMGLSTSDPNTYGEAITMDSYVLPKNGRPVYLEMHYKCNTPFIIRLRGISTDGLNYDYDIGGLNSSDGKWKKFYYALTPELIKFTQGDKFHVIFRMTRNLDIANQELYLDNLKLIY